MVAKTSIAAVNLNKQPGLFDINALTAIAGSYQIDRHKFNV